MTQLQIDKGMRVRLLYTSSRYLRPLIGQKGTVIDIDEPIDRYEYGTFIRDNRPWMHWDSGRCTGIIDGEDYVEYW